MESHSLRFNEPMHHKFGLLNDLIFGFVIPGSVVFIPQLAILPLIGKVLMAILLGIAGGFFQNLGKSLWELIKEKYVSKNKRKNNRK